MIVVVIIGVLGALVFQSAAANARRVEVANIRNNIISLIRSSQAIAIKENLPVSLHLSGELSLPGSLDVVSTFIWLDKNRNWIVDFPGEATWTVGSVAVEGYVRGSGQTELSQTYATNPAVAGCNNGIGGGHPQIAVLLPEGLVIDTVQNVCTFRIYLQNPTSGLATQIQIQPSGQIVYADSF